MAYSKDGLVPVGRSDLWGQHLEWKYWSADPIATVNTAGYISNGKKMGLKVGNKVTVHDTVNNLTHICFVVSVNSTTGAADLTDGLAVTSTNSD